jgi:hypothetical protein
MGIENIATDSDNQILESSKVEQIIRKRNVRLTYQDCNMSVLKVQRES